MTGADLTLWPFYWRATRLFPEEEVVSRTAGGQFRYTYGDVGDRVPALAAGLDALGVEAGDRVGTLGWNHHRHYEAYFAVPLMGAQIHTINVQLPDEHVEHIVNDAGDDVLLVDPSMVGTVERLWDRFDTVREVVVMGGSGAGELPDSRLDLHAYEDLVTRARNYQPDAEILGVQVQEMVDLDAGVETIVGMNRDPQFGPLVMFGLGGIFVEVLEDTTFRVAPVSGTEAREMTEEIDAAPLLRGARGREPTDVAAVAETIQRLSQLVTDFPAILELDINPLVATPDGAQAVDVRLTVDLDELDVVPHAEKPLTEPDQ
jgi:hypothetical protein